MLSTYKILKLDRYDKNNERKSREYYNNLLINDVLQALDEELKNPTIPGWDTSLERHCKYKIENKLLNNENVDILKYTSNISKDENYNANLNKIKWEYLNSLPVLARGNYGCTIRDVVEYEENTLLVTYFDFWEFVTVKDGKFKTETGNEIHYLKDFYTPPYGSELMSEVNRLYNLYAQGSNSAKRYDSLERIVESVEDFIKKEKQRNSIEMRALIDEMISKKII